jgi:hypothetical protein
LIDHTDSELRARTTYVVGVDPGSSTGLVIVRGDGFKMHAQQGTPSQALDDFTIRFPFLTIPSSDVLVACERYVITDQTARRSAQPVPLQVIGVVSHIARLNGWPLHMQSPSDVKSLVPNVMLREVNLYTTPREVEQHDANDVNDAMRHALAALAYHRASLFDKILLSSSV